MFGAEITHARERRKLTKQDLAHATGLSYQHIHNVEVGHRPLTLDVFRKLHKRLKFPQRVLAAFLRGDPEGGSGPLTRASLVLLLLC